MFPWHSFFVLSINFVNFSEKQFDATRDICAKIISKSLQSFKSHLKMSLGYKTLKSYRKLWLLALYLIFLFHDIMPHKDFIFCRFVFISFVCVFFRLRSFCETQPSIFHFCCFFCCVVCFPNSLIKSYESLPFLSNCNENLVKL